MDAERLSDAARTFRDNEAVQTVLTRMRFDAYEALASLDAANADDIRDQQAIVRVVNDLQSRIEIMARESERPKPGLA